MDNITRPLSPHLQIYRLPMTAVLSITHRFTGILLCVALPAFGASLLLASAGSSSFGSMQLFLGQVLAKIGMMLCVFALVFHWCHGVRHLFMDIGKTLDKETMPRYVMLEIAISAMLTAVAALIILAE